MGKNTNLDREFWALTFITVALGFLSETLAVTVKLPELLQIGFGWQSAGKGAKSRCKGLLVAAKWMTEGPRQLTIALNTGSVTEVVKTILHALCHILSGDNGHGTEFQRLATVFGFSDARPQLMNVTTGFQKIADTLIKATDEKVGYSLPFYTVNAIEKAKTPGYLLQLTCAEKSCERKVYVTENEFFGGKESTTPDWLICERHNAHMILSESVTRRPKNSDRILAILKSLYPDSETLAA